MLHGIGQTRWRQGIKATHQMMVVMMLLLGCLEMLLVLLLLQQLLLQVGIVVLQAVLIVLTGRWGHGAEGIHGLLLMLLLLLEELLQVIGRGYRGLTRTAGHAIPIEMVTRLLFDIGRKHAAVPGVVLLVVGRGCRLPVLHLGGSRRL